MRYIFLKMSGIKGKNDHITKMVSNHIKIATSFGVEIKNRINASPILNHANQRVESGSCLSKSSWFVCEQYSTTLPSKTQKKAINFKACTSKISTIFD